MRAYSTACCCHVHEPLFASSAKEAPWSHTAIASETATTRQQHHFVFTSRSPFRALFGLLGFYLWIKFFPKSPFGRQIILKNDAHDWHGFDPEQKKLVGAEGVSHTPLRPAGVAIINGRRLDVVTRGEQIAAAQPIRVIKVEGNRVVVTTIEPTETQA